MDHNHEADTVEFNKMIALNKVKRLLKDTSRKGTCIITWVTSILDIEIFANTKHIFSKEPTSKQIHKFNSFKLKL